MFGELAGENLADHLSGLVRVGYNLATACGLTPDGVRAWFREAWEIIDEESESSLRMLPVACKKGCSHCCHIPVGVCAAEAILIFEDLPGSAREALRARPTDEREIRDACSMLLGGSCSVYGRRPFPCRSENSMLAADCEDPDGKSKRLATLMLIPEAVQMGGLRAWMQARLDVEAVELSLALAHLARDPDPGTLLDRWCAGQKMFEDPQRMTIRGRDGRGRATSIRVGGKVMPNSPLRVLR